jgi:putative NIF3 family GTP cyclohydrolase 1 type 2
MEHLSSIVSKLDTFFDVKKLARDPAFSRFIPRVYDSIGFDWQHFFEACFVNRFNGLMLRGSETVVAVHCAAFPRKEVLEQFIENAEEGDLFFSHHPIDIECGDPKDMWGRGFIPIEQSLLEALVKKKLSFYSCHAPLDYNKKISTSRAIVEALNGLIEDDFLPYGNGFAGFICSIKPITTNELIDVLQRVFEIPYVDFEGPYHKEVSKIAVAAGGGDNVEYMRAAEAKGVQAYVTGEIHARIDNEPARKEFSKIKSYASQTTLSLIGVSHAASEYLVMKNSMTKWFEQNFDLKTKLLPESKWWR